MTPSYQSLRQSSKVVLVQLTPNHGGIFLFYLSNIYTVGGQRFGELLVFAGVIIVILSLAGVRNIIELPVDGEQLALAAVALIIIGEAIILK